MCITYHQYRCSLQLRSVTASRSKLRQSGLRFISLGFLNLSLLTDFLLPCSSYPLLAATTWRAAAPFVTSSPSPLPATSILQVCPPLLFPFCCARRSTPNPNKTICTRISMQLQYITYYDFVRKNYRYAGSAPDTGVRPWCC